MIGPTFGKGGGDGVADWNLLARLESLLVPRIKNEIHSRVGREKGALIAIDFQALKKIPEPGGLSP